MNQNPSIVSSYLQRYERLKQARASWVSTWKELRNYLAPTRGMFEADTPNNGRRIDHKTLLDSSASLAVNILTSGMMSGLTNPSRSWFDVTLEPQDLTQLPGARAWLLDVKKQLQSAFAQSNLYSVLQGVYEEVGVFGTAAFLVEADPKGGIFCRPFTVGEYVLDVDDKGRPNTFGREFVMTASELAHAFGKERLPGALQQELARPTGQSGHKVIHLIFPNPSANGRYNDRRYFAFRSVYFMPDGTLLRQGGYHEFPVVAARWEVKNTSQVYGQGPGWKCLGDVKMLQKMQKTKLVALDKSTNPPVMVSSQVQGEVNLLPGGVTRCSSLGEAAVRPAYDVRPDLAALESAMESVRQTIRSQFFADVFMMLAAQDHANLSATEVAERRQEKMLLLGPVLERLKNELLDPLVERTYHILLRQGFITPAPSVLHGLEMQVRYISSIAQAQRATQLEALSQGVSWCAQLAQLDPTLPAQIDGRRALREGLESLGVANALLEEPRRSLPYAQNNRLA